MDDSHTEAKEPVAASPITATAVAPRAPRPERVERRNTRERRARPERPRPEFDEKMLALKRVARVSKGGRRFNFSAAVVVGNRRGAVGVAIGKGADTALAMEKATRSARKGAVRPALSSSSSIAHEARAKYSSAIVEIRPAPGRGLVAGSAARAVLELAGIKDVSAKVLSGSKNKFNIAQATIKALATLQKPRSNKSIPTPLPL